MTEKPKKPLPPMPKLPPHHGEKAPIRYPDSAGKRLGNWLIGLLTPWK